MRVKLWVIRSGNGLSLSDGHIVLIFIFNSWWLVVSLRIWDETGLSKALRAASDMWSGFESALVVSFVTFVGRTGGVPLGGSRHLNIIRWQAQISMPVDYWLNKLNCSYLHQMATQKNNLCSQVIFSLLMGMTWSGGQQIFLRSQTYSSHCSSAPWVFTTQVDERILCLKSWGRQHRLGESSGVLFLETMQHLKHLQQIVSQEQPASGHCLLPPSWLGWLGPKLLSRKRRRITTVKMSTPSLGIVKSTWQNIT